MHRMASGFAYSKTLRKILHFAIIEAMALRESLNAGEIFNCPS